MIIMYIACYYNIIIAIIAIIMAIIIICILLDISIIFIIARRARLGDAPTEIVGGDRICMRVYTYIHVYIYIYIYRERDIHKTKT